jgi:serine/threonine protein kinase
VDEGQRTPDDHWSGRFQEPVRVGTGGQAEVFRAFDPVLEDDVALKVIHAQQADLPDWRARLIAEARATRRVGGERLAVVHDIVELDGRLALVMEYAAAGTLADRLAGLASPLTHDDLARLVAELAECLRALEAAGMVHRDLKPSNLLIRSLDATPPGQASDEPGSALLGGRERLIVTDLGLARSADQSSVTLASGTAGYQAPEQMLATAVLDHRADLFAATQVVLAAACGRPLMRDEIPGRVSDPDAARRLTACLAADPDERPADADAWAASMRAVVGPLSGEPSAPGRQDRHGLMVRALVATVVLALLAGAGYGLWFRPDDGSLTPAPGGPQIIGPDTLLIGEPGTYRHEDRAGVDYEWRLPSGERLSTLMVTLTPNGPDDLALWLTSDDAGDVRSSRLEIRVRTR